MPKAWVQIGPFNDEGDPLKSRRSSPLQGSCQISINSFGYLYTTLRKQLLQMGIQEGFQVQGRATAGQQYPERITLFGGLSHSFERVGDSQLSTLHNPF